MAFKSEKDKEAYVGKLRAAGFTPEEIDADVAEIEASKPAPVAPPSSTPAAAAVAPPKSAPVASTNLQPGNATELVSKLAEAAQARSEQNQDLTGQVLGNQLSQAIKDLSGSDLGKVGLAVGAGYGLYKAGRLAERKFGPSGELDVSRRVEPTMEPPRESARLSEAAQQPKLSATDEALLARSEANRLAKEQEAARRAATAVPEPIPEPPAFIRNQPPAGSAAPPVVTTPVAPVTPAPVAPAAPVVEAPVVQTTAPVAEQPVAEAETPKTQAAKPAKEKVSKGTQPAGTGGADNWLHSAVGTDIYRDVIKRKNDGKPYGPGEEAQKKAYKDWREYQNEVGRMRPYTRTPVLNLQALEEQKFRSANIPGKIPLSAIPPPPTVRPTEIGQGGSLLRTLTDQLQLKQ